MHRNHVWSALIVGGLAAASAPAASGADLRAYPVKALPAAPVFDWSGIYVGGHAGYAGGGKDWYIPSASGPSLQSHVNLEGALAGGQIGINQQFGHLVLGIEGAMAWSGLRGSSSLPIGSFSLAFGDRADWLATVTGRAGFAVDRWLVYVRAGAAWAHERHSFDAVLPPGTLALQGDETRTGWLVGGGVEWALAGNWSARLAYDYIDFGQRRIDLPGTAFGAAAVGRYDIQQKVQLATIGVNYRFWQGSAVAAAPVQSAAGYSWAGPYIGAHVGYGWGRTTWDDDRSSSYQVSGTLGGIQLGFNAQHGHLVLGVEADVSAASINGDTTYPSFFINPNDTTNTLSSRIDWLGTATARLGFALDRWLVYGKAGVAWAHERHAGGSSFPAGAALAFDGHEWRSGLTAGGGVEVALLDRWSLKAEYDYINFSRGGVSMTGAISGGPFPAGPFSGALLVRQDLHVVKLGANYHFAPAPVVAKY